MSSDWLEEATAALREEGAQAPGPAITRARIMRSLHGNRRKRHTQLAVAIPLAAVFFGGVAYGAATGELPRMIDNLAEKVGLGSGPERLSEGEGEGEGLTGRGGPLPTAASKAAEPEPESEPEPEPDPEEAVEADEVEQPDEALASGAPPKSAPADGSSPSPQGAPASSTAPEPAKPAAPTGPDSHAIYRQAHQAHFSQRDYSAALAGWERYLKAAPRGRFAAEAAYNRAICLVRLGRTAQARQALEPFAKGSYGGYRQSEAQQLLDAL